MVAKILCLSDLHKRYNESSNIKGLPKVHQLIQEEIIDYIYNNEVTHVIIPGDWYDRGFHGLGQAYGAIEMDRRLSTAVNGEVYLCVGNHFYLERDENPEMYIIQPNEYIKPAIPIPVPEKPIFKMVQTLQIGTVQIDFFHFNKINKEYIAYRKPETTFHIGIYHDDITLPSWIREQEGFTGTSSQSYLNRIYDNIDLAIHGHIHTKIGQATLNIGDTGRRLPIVVPGALAPTQNKDNMKHTSVDLPIIEIHETDGVYTVSMSFATFSTHLDMLRFSEKKVKKKGAELRDTGYMSLPDEKLLSGSAATQSLPQYLLSKGYDTRELKLLDAAANHNLNLTTAISILAEIGDIV